MAVNNVAVAETVRALLVALGQDVTSDGLRETPGRVARSYSELLGGYQCDVPALFKDFDSGGYDQMIVLRGVPFYSLCEHHLLPFHGIASVAYIPGNGRVVGLSKLARLVDAFARRLQVQERMTKQIADALKEHLAPIGWGVLVRAQHLCMCARGVRAPGSEMITSVMGGAFKDDRSARNEFLRLAGM